MFNFDLKKVFWIFEPKQYELKEDIITITTDPNTDFWQRNYYGFRNDNAPALLTKTDEKYFSKQCKIHLTLCSVWCTNSFVEQTNCKGDIEYVI